MTARRDAGQAPFWDAVLRTPGWDVVHTYDSALEGWMVLVLRRHVGALADLTEDEAAELGPLVHRLSRALHAVLGCEKTYVVQHQGPRVFALLGRPEEERVPEAHRDEIARAVRIHLTA